MAEEDAFARDLIAQEKELERIEEEKAKQEAAAKEAGSKEESKGSAKLTAKPAPKVATSKSVGRAKRGTVHRIAPVKPPPKGQSKKAG